MKVKIRLKTTSQPILHENIKNTYQKGSFFCLYDENEKVTKYPIKNIFDIEEDYGEH
jgi:hypothetical protein